MRNVHLYTLHLNWLLEDCGLFGYTDVSGSKTFAEAGLFASTWAFSFLSDCCRAMLADITRLSCNCAFFWYSCSSHAIKYRNLGTFVLTEIGCEYVTESFTEWKVRHEYFAFNTKLPLLTMLASKDFTEAKRIVTSSRVWPDDYWIKSVMFIILS